MGMSFIKSSLKNCFGKGADKFNTLVLLFPDGDAELLSAVRKYLGAYLRRQAAEKVAVITSVGADFLAGAGIFGVHMALVPCSVHTMERVLSYWTICGKADFIKNVSLKMPGGRNLQNFQGKGEFTAEILVWHFIFEQFGDIPSSETI
jgi:hypothetical protein